MTFLDYFLLLKAKIACCVVFFFQAEDGIRDGTVTGVQTCALPILDAALAQIERAFGKGSIMKLGQREAVEIESISTGSLGLDIALGIGGLPKGRVVEIYGPESSGKTTLSLHV